LTTADVAEHQLRIARLHLGLQRQPCCGLRHGRAVKCESNAIGVLLPRHETLFPHSLAERVPHLRLREHDLDIHDEIERAGGEDPGFRRSRSVTDEVSDRTVASGRRGSTVGSNWLCSGTRPEKARRSLSRAASCRNFCFRRTPARSVSESPAVRLRRSPDSAEAVSMLGARSRLLEARPGFRDSSSGRRVSGRPRARQQSLPLLVRGSGRTAAAHAARAAPHPTPTNPAYRVPSQPAGGTRGRERRRGRS
jgi:hypothetical protein